MPLGSGSCGRVRGPGEPVHAGFLPSGQRGVDGREFRALDEAFLPDVDALEERVVEEASFEWGAREARGVRGTGPAERF